MDNDNDLERCPYCGGRFKVPCDEPPPDTCSQALEHAFMDGRWMELTP